MGEDIVIKPVDTGYRLVVTAELTPDEEEGGYSVYCPELDIYTQGNDVKDAIANLQEVATGYIKVVGIDNLNLCPKPVISYYIMQKVFESGDKVASPLHVHRAKILRLGTLNGILRKARIDRERLIEWLRLVRPIGSWGVSIITFNVADLCRGGKSEIDGSSQG